MKSNLKKPRKEREDLLGDRLDDLSMRMQDGQSVGIPIGPETSHVLAEVVLSAVDSRFQEIIGKPLRGFRALDDYELAFESRSDAEKALAELQSTLLKYELQLNESKTCVVKLPDVLQDTWTSTLRNVRAGDLLALFSRAFELVHKHPDKSILRYAISIAHGVDLARDSWPVYQDILLQCAASEPGTLRYVTTELARARAADLRIDETGVRELCSYLIRAHAPLGHGSEVAWALWLAIVLDVSLPARELSGLTQMVDPFVPVLAMWAEECGQIVGGQLERAGWVETTVDEGLAGGHWLLAYEGATRGWLGGDAERKVAEHEVFGWLSEKDVSFFDGEASVLNLNRWSEMSPYGELPDSGGETGSPNPSAPF
ncbi:MAG: RNA-directed DNA polymerase [Gemmatimonadetes bacterium]|nr:RNA-directed DNA polymerase [Gemmatimonadota bacterium]MYJ12297.1 RNA-directed DNA polymerase [Gemmatimonadota bacterium]